MTSPSSNTNATIQPRSSEDSRMRLLYLVAREFNHSLDLTQTLHRVLIAMVRLVGAQNASVFVFDGQERLIKTVLVREGRVQESPPDSIQAVINEGLAGWVMRQRQSVLSQDVLQDERWYALPRDDDRPRHRSAICVPLLSHNELQGVLTITNAAPAYFDTGDLTLLEAIAEQAATAVRNARLHQVERRRHDVFGALIRVSEQLSSHFNEHELINELLEILIPILPHDQSGFYFWNSNHYLSLYAARNIPNYGELMALQVKLYPDDFAEPILTRYEAVYTNSLQAENSWFKDVADRQCHSWIGVPLIANQRLLGVLTIASHNADTYEAADLELLRIIANQAAVALTNARSLTLLHDAAEQYVRLFEENSDLILVITPDGNIRDVNRKTCQIFRRPKDALVGSNLILLSRNLRDVLESLRDQLNSAQEVTTEVDIKDAYGHEIPVEITAKQISYEGEVAIQWVGRDITVRRELAKMRRDFINMIVHDLRGPVGAMVNAVQMIDFLLTGPEEMFSREETGELTRLAIHSSRFVTDLIDSMLDISKHESGSFPLKVSTTSVDKLLRDAHSQVIPHASSKSITLSFADVSQDTLINLDHHLVRRVIVNLVDNAIKYTPGGGQVVVAVEWSEEHLIVHVSDNGPGIPPDKKQTIFEKFARLRETADIQGVGLGLAFCKIAVEAHQGQIWLESEINKGSTFSFSIPRTLEEQIFDDD